jgi:uncharacterized protein with ACT and thioredoxin-like domain
MAASNARADRVLARPEHISVNTLNVVGVEVRYVGMVASPLASLSRGGANIRELNSE